MREEATQEHCVDGQNGSASHATEVTPPALSEKELLNRISLQG